MVEFGFFALGLGFCCALYALVTACCALWLQKSEHNTSAFSKSTAVADSARNAVWAVHVCVAIAAVVLWVSLFAGDFSVQYVFRNSAVDMPLVYIFTAFWSALEGSHLLWTLLMSTMCSLALLTLRPSNSRLLPGILVTFAGVLTFMLLLNIWASAPLTRQFPVGFFGMGMNPLLQNPYMAIHPPCLFSGYCTLVVPFAYGVAALLNGRFPQDWLITVRRWTLAAWTILTVGIFLGGKWAYVELGWAGYWAWDPVENSSFMPWLATTASLHTLLILDKTGRLPRLATFLPCLAFALTFLGTFITRSNIISSVHAFAESNIGPIYLAFIVLMLAFSLGLLVFQGPKLPGAVQQRTWLLSKETLLLFTNFFFLFLLGLVLIGTLLPLVVEAVRGVKISIQQPFFNAFTPWIGIGLVGLVGVGNLLRWHKGELEDGVSSLCFPALWALCLTLCLHFRKDLNFRSFVGFYLVLWSINVLLMDILFRLRQVRWQGVSLLKYNRPYLGSWLTHVGFLLAVLGFLGNYRGLEADVHLKKNQSTRFYGYTLTYEGLTYREGSNVKVVGAQIRARKDFSQEDVMIEPMREKYTNKDEWFNEVGVHSTFWHDVYLVLGSFDTTNSDQVVSLKMHINPTVKFVWTSLVIMVLGALVGLSHTFRKRSLNLLPNALELETASVWSRGVSSVLIVLLALGVSVFGFSAYAEEPTPLAPAVQLPAAVRAIGEQLRCPTCQGLSILDSDTPQSTAMKTEIAKQLQAGVPEGQILSFFQQRYGDWILRKPPVDSQMGMLFWFLPIISLILGPCVLIGRIRSGQKVRKGIGGQEGDVALKEDDLIPESFRVYIQDYLKTHKEQLLKHYKYVG